MRERWEYIIGKQTGTLTEEHLQSIVPQNGGSDNVLINGAVFATNELYEAISSLNPEEQLVKGVTVLAARVTDNAFEFNNGLVTTVEPKQVEYRGEVDLLEHNWDIFSKNGAAIRSDFELLTKEKQSQPLPDGIHTQGKEQIFLEEGAKINAGCILNATTGPIYIGKNAEVLEGVMMRGPIALGEEAAIKMGAKVYGDTTIGPHCKVGGELSNVVFFSYSNKGHDGYLGNSVIGEWCNLGADTNCSNLKNNYESVKVWDEHRFKSVQTGLTFCGLIMGDHSKCGINTMFNTGTVVGVSANIFGGGFPEKFIPSFTWGGSDGLTTYRFERAVDTANRMMERRGKSLTENDLAMLKHVMSITEKQRELFTKTS